MNVNVTKKQVWSSEISYYELTAYNPTAEDLRKMDFIEKFALCAWIDFKSAAKQNPYRAVVSIMPKHSPQIIVNGVDDTNNFDNTIKHVAKITAGTPIGLASHYNENPRLERYGTGFNHAIELPNKPNLSNIADYADELEKYVGERSEGIFKNVEIPLTKISMSKKTYLKIEPKIKDLSEDVLNNNTQFQKKFYSEEIPFYSK